jgi:hypothetical protein
MFSVSTSPTRRSVLAASAAAGVCGLVLFAAGWQQRLPSADAQGTPRPPAAKAPSAAIKFTADGKLERPPVDYRKWVSLGTPLTLDEGTAPQFHAVYMDPEGFAHYERTGKFRDGTVLVKEFIGVGSTDGSSGKGYFMGEFEGLQVSIKDSRRFKDQPGHWAYFDFGKRPPIKAEAARKATASCNKCHQDNAKTDWVFSQYYPVLRVAAPRPK